MLHRLKLNMMTPSSCRWLWSAACAAFLVSTAFGSPQDSASSAPSLSPSAQAQLRWQLEQAQESVHQGDLAAATKSLHRALAIDPHSLLALNELAIVLSRQGKPAEAIPWYQQALKLRPEDPVLRRNLAIAHFKAQQYRSAWNLLEPLAVSFPTDFQILDLAGLSLFALDLYADAARYLERANQADPSDLETLDMLGKAYLKMKDYKALPSVFARIMNINPNSASAHVMMGTAYDEMSDGPNAIKEYQAAVDADPKFVGAHSGLGYLYWRQGQAENAEKEMRAELEHFPNDPVANCILGQILFNNSQLEDARSHFELALQANPGYGDALLGLGKAEIALNRPDAAIPPLRKAIQLDASSAEAHFVLGTALRKSGHAAEGLREQKISLAIQNQKSRDATSP
jgi:tetratricopeptide (TPR) repeat protein